MRIENEFNFDLSPAFSEAKKGLSHLVRPKKSEKVLKKTIFTAKSVNETEKVEFLRNSSEFMDFFYRRFLPLDVFNTSSGRKTTLLVQI